MAAGLAAAVLGCSQPRFPTPPSPAPVNAHVSAKRLHVGAARADVTPPPGVSLFGHGPEGRVADGYWSRLYCRAFVFASDGDSPLAVVTCDLSAIGMLLQRAVAERVAGTGLLPTRIMLSATHTPAGPAHYLEGTFYGSLMSSREPGFDPKMLSFLADRIASALREALEHAGPARLSWAHAALWGMSRNRSLVPFQQNQPPYSPDPRCRAGAPPATLLPSERAVDPCLDVLWVDALDDQGQTLGPIGALTFFAMHPTVLPNTNRLLDADVDGVASRAVERQMRREWLAHPRPGAREPLAALVNTNEGDVSPVWHEGTQDEAIALGEALGAHIAETRGSAQAVAPVIDARYVEVHLPGSRLLDGKTGLCESAQLGLAAPKGASDHPTALTLIGDFRDENVDFRSGSPCDAPRIPVLGPVQQLVSGPGSFPEDVPLALAQIGDTLLSFVPAEMTVTAGARLARAVAAEAEARGLGADRSVVVSLANGYLQYVTTEEEYTLQHYEGASNLYGRWTDRWLTERYALLARAMAGIDVTPWLPDVDRIHPLPYAVAAQRDRLATTASGPPISEVRGRGSLGLCRLSSDPVSVCFWWHDGAPGVVFPADGPRWVGLVEDGAAATPVVDPEDPSMPIDDRGLWFRTEVHERLGKGYGWSTWMAATREEWSRWLGQKRARIQVGRGPRAIASEPFSSSGDLAGCSPRQIIFCGVGR
jgi:neutral ceramidase